MRVIRICLLQNDWDAGFEYIVFYTIDRLFGNDHLDYFLTKIVRKLGVGFLSVVNVHIYYKNIISVISVISRIKCIFLCCFFVVCFSFRVFWISVDVEKYRDGNKEEDQKDEYHIYFECKLRNNYFLSWKSSLRSL